VFQHVFMYIGSAAIYSPDNNEFLNFNTTKVLVLQHVI